MSDEQRLELAALLLRLLADDKLEIRELACTTLSGLLQCLEERPAASVRARIMDEALKVFPAGKRKRVAAAPAGDRQDKAALTRAHASVLGLKAALLSSPYEIAPWMSDVLLAIVRAARMPVPVKATATGSLGLFRKTHEASESRPLKERLDPDVWSSICDVANASSYFV
jgi:proteasome activator subunit 4